jgi:hypothetical protein
MLVIVVNAAFLIPALWVAMAPREPLAERVRRAFASGDLIPKDWPWLDSRRGFDQFNDCSILQMITIHDDDTLANAVGPLSYNKNKGHRDKCATLRKLVDEGPHTAQYLVFRYTRYWHGYNPISAALLLAFDLADVRKILKIALYGSFVVLLAAAGVRHRGLFAVAAGIAVTGVLFWAVPYFGQALGHAPGDIFVILGLAGLFWWRQRLSRLATLVPFCAVYGAGVVYLEFMTGQLPTAAGLLFPTAYLIARARPEPDSEPRQRWLLAVAALAAFALGGALTVTIKQVLAVAIVGPDAVGSFLDHVGRYAGLSHSMSLLLWSKITVKTVYAVLGEGYVLTYGSNLAAVVLYSAAALAWLTAGYLAFRRPARWASSDLLAFVAGAAIVVAWMGLFQIHTAIHKWWMVRMLIVPISLGWGALAWQLIAIPLEHRTTSVWTTSKEMRQAAN